ncbi:hypothetical protein SAMN04487843_12388 [Methylobacterium sp. ap11]|jgi:hypothetical protein|uniref:hypothetical protein n=1 Tax=Methylobacterium sp. ap11 TaxID=1761799 RepID=UPI0008B0F4DB|nr:hypothetical protein [Methylobacterium sp. ap11]SEP46477.1 hypothetical protein SAMN04487843_12388 [Methylobacterium sp. ap11]
MERPQHVDGPEPADLDHRRGDDAADAEAGLAAAFLVEVMGEDVAAAFFARFGPVMAQACRQAEDLAHGLRAEDEPETELPARRVRRTGTPWGDLPWGNLPPEDRTRIDRLAERIGRGEACAPVIVMMRRTAADPQPYDLISGADEFVALVDVMGRATVPVRVVPPVPPETLSLFDDPEA